MPARLQLHIQEPLELQIPNSSKASFGQLLRMLVPARAGALHAKTSFHGSVCVHKRLWVYAFLARSVPLH
jgi:hypothetical protein